ncbi:MAG: hypothetical protein IJ074_01065 [Clostridia bacterium]|nr:hypothetical protein [Clostridia bacterium]
MNKKMMETAPRQQSQSPSESALPEARPNGADTNSTDSIVTNNGAVVNPSDMTIHGSGGAGTGLPESKIQSSHLPRDVKALKDMIHRRSIPLMDITEVVKTIYPKCDKTLISKCANGNEYGIQLRKDALAALKAHFRETAQIAQNRPQQGGRAKPKRIYCRLTEGSYAALQRLISRSGLTMQGFIENLILNELKKEEEKKHDESREDCSGTHGNAR